MYFKNFFQNIFMVLIILKEKNMKYNEELMKKRGKNLKAYFERFGLVPSMVCFEKYTIIWNCPNPYNGHSLKPSEVSGWFKGGYLDKKTNKKRGGLSKEKASTFIEVIQYLRSNYPDIYTHYPVPRLEYLLGDDEYMTEEDFFQAAFDRSSKDMENHINFTESILDIIRQSGWKVSEFYVDDENPISDVRYRLEKNDKYIIMTPGKFNSFADAIKEYADITLKHLF